MNKHMTWNGQASLCDFNRGNKTKRAVFNPLKLFKNFWAMMLNDTYIEWTTTLTILHTLLIPWYQRPDCPASVSFHAHVDPIIFWAPLARRTALYPSCSIQWYICNCSHEAFPCVRLTPLGKAYIIIGGPLPHVLEIALTKGLKSCRRESTGVRIWKINMDAKIIITPKRRMIRMDSHMPDGRNNSFYAQESLITSVTPASDNGNCMRPGMTRLFV